MAGPILVVEDEPLVRLDMVDMLRSSGYDVIDVGSTDDANAVLQRRDDISLVCTDVLLPGQVDGLALTRWIKANRLQVSVILVTAELPATVPPPVGDALIPKPVAVDRLFQTVGELLKSRA